MRSGRLDRRIELQHYTTTIGATGQRVHSWVTFATVWANVSFMGGSESEKSDSEFHRRRCVFTIRYNTDVNAKYRISWDSKVFDILTVEETHYTRQRFMKLHCELRGVQDGN